jgi:uncharacterized FAD-dependent dehydrogenase
VALRLDHIEIPAEEAGRDSVLRDAVARELDVDQAEITGVRIIKKSLDARRKNRIVYHFHVNVDLRDEASVLARNQTRASVATESPSADPTEGIEAGELNPRHRPIIVGTGPAGTFAALVMIRKGIMPILIDRGLSVEQRLRSVNRLRQDGTFDPESNYCFGEGGAGTFSDGKLTCGRNHPLVRYVFDQWVEHGAPEDILWDAKPHIGTDYLMRIAIRMRQYLESQGATFKFGARLVDVKPATETAKHTVLLDSGELLPTDHLVMAIGHSARDTYQMLLDRGVHIVQKPFAIGARIEHPQDQINRIQFGSCSILPAAEYKLVTHVEQRGIWTFCMCPGGHLMPTNAQADHLAINGMSYHARNSGFANAAVVVNVLRDDYNQGHPLDGMRFQEKLEKQAFIAGGKGYHAPAQRLVDFVSGRDSKGELKTTYRPGVNAARMDRVLPSFVVDALKVAVHEYNKKMRGYLSSEALIVGLESKTSSPISMPRGKDLQSLSHSGLFPSGEGAGFAGGIVSAALDGVRVGRAVLQNMMPATSIVAASYDLRNTSESELVQ